MADGIPLIEDGIGDPDHWTPCFFVYSEFRSDVQAPTHIARTQAEDAARERERQEWNARAIRYGAALDEIAHGHQGREPHVVRQIALDALTQQDAAT